MPPQGPSLRWSAFEREHIERGPDWFWALGVAAVSICLTAVLFHDVLFGILILVAAAILAYIARTPPELAEFELSDRGIRVNETLYPYEHILAFYVLVEAERPLLLVDTTRIMSPNLILPIEEIDPDLVREYLKERCTERQMKEPLGHRALEWLGL